MRKLTKKGYRNWEEKERIAFWINAYNAITLRVIIDHYPIKASALGSLRYPKNSIRQIPGAWKKLKFRIREENWTLDEIEHTALRGWYNEPRIHVALVCAAMGCPPLRDEPYVAARLGEQLDDQSQKFLKKWDKFRIDRKKKRVYLSSIFKWFGEDFVKTYGTNKKFAKHNKKERAVLNFVSKHLSETNRNYLLNNKYGIKYLDYDWSLNEQ